MGDIEITPMVLFILKTGPSLVKISFFGIRETTPRPPKTFFYPGDLGTSNSARMNSNQIETRLHRKMFYLKVFRGL